MFFHSFKQIASEKENGKLGLSFHNYTEFLREITYFVYWGDNPKDFHYKLWPFVHLFQNFIPYFFLNLNLLHLEKLVRVRFLPDKSLKISLNLF